MEGLIKVHYISGLDKGRFEGLNEFGYKVEIPENVEPRIMALAVNPDDYIVIFTIYFSLRVVEEIVDQSEKAIVSQFGKVIKRIWENHKDVKPAKLDSSLKPEFKLPKAVVSFQVSENEISKFEITNEINSKELEIAAETFLKLVELQYKNRKDEGKLRKKIEK